MRRWDTELTRLGSEYVTYWFRYVLKTLWRECWQQLLLRSFFSLTFGLAWISVWSSQLFDSPLHLVHFTMREVTRLNFDCMRRKEGHGCNHRQIQALIGPLHRVGRFPCSLTWESTDPFLFWCSTPHRPRVSPLPFCDRTLTSTESVHSSLVQVTKIPWTNQKASGSVDPTEHRVLRSALRKVLRLVFLVFKTKVWESANIVDGSATRNQQGCSRTQPME